ncbi:hypothetical protein BKA83DRAFT_4128911 [Pisolithus microcarpus]|nr:hypothetical protein BKA83DRAFT_4128911 [Pisolithus microcarpus]
MGLLHPFYGGTGILHLSRWGNSMVMEILQVPVWDFSMGVEIPQLPEWDFPMPSMWGGDSPIMQLEILHGFSNSQCGISPCLLWEMGILQVPMWDVSMGVGILQKPEWDFSMAVEIPQLPEWDFPMPSMWGGDSPIRQLEILHGCGDSPTARMGFLPPFYGGMGNLQLNRWQFSMGEEIPQLPWWDFPMPSMGGSWRFSMDVEIPQLPEWDFSPLFLGGMANLQLNQCGFSLAVEILQVPMWDFPMGVEILQVPMWDFPMGVEIPQLPWWDFPMPSMGGGDSPIRQLEILHGWGDFPTARMGFLPPFYGGMWNLQLNRWRFSMGVEIPQLPNWDFSTPFMGMGNPQLSRWGILHGDSPIEKLGKLQIFNGCGDSHLSC